MNGVDTTNLRHYVDLRCRWDDAWVTVYVYGGAKNAGCLVIGLDKVGSWFLPQNWDMVR